MSLRDLILSTAAPAPGGCETPRGTVFVRQMTVLEREQVRPSCAMPMARPASAPRWCKTATEPDGTRCLGRGLCRPVRPAV